MSAVHNSQFLYTMDIMEDMGTEIDSAFVARAGWKRSQGGNNSRVSEPVCEMLSVDMSVAELHNTKECHMKTDMSEHKCIVL